MWLEENLSEREFILVLLCIVKSVIYIDFAILLENTVS